MQPGCISLVSAAQSHVPQSWPRFSCRLLPFAGYHALRLFSLLDIDWTENIEVRMLGRKGKEKSRRERKKELRNIGNLGSPR